MCFVNLFKFKKKNKFKIVQKNFQEIKIALVKKKDFLGKPLVTMIIT